MVYITKHSLRASEATDIHTFVLVRILKQDHEKCVSFSLDMGKNDPDLVDILGRIVLVDTIVNEDGGAYLDNVFKRISPVRYGKHRPFVFNNSEYTCEL